MNLLIFTALCGGVYWLSLQDWSTGGPNSASGDSEPLASRQASVQDLQWSADGNTFLSRSVGKSECDFSVLLHRLADQRSRPASSARQLARQVTTELIPGVDRHIWNALMLPDAKALIAVGENQIISRIEIESGARTDLLDASALDRVPALAISPDGSQFAVALDGEVRLYDPRLGRERRRLAGRASVVGDLVFSGDRQSIAAGYGDGTIRVWSVASGKVLHDLARHNGPATRVRFVPGSARLASIGLYGDDTFRLWDLQSGNLIWQAAGGEMGLFGLAISADGSLAATGGNNGDIVLWNMHERTRGATLSGHTGAVRSLQFSPDGATLTSGSSDGTICFWDVGTSDLLSSFDVGEIRFGDGPQS